MSEIDPASSVVVWRNPPAESAFRLQRVIAELKRRPGDWAQIATSTPLSLHWWSPLRDMADFEVTTRRTNASDTAVFGPRDVYARYVGRLGDRLQPGGGTPAE